jgi:hypothetical protein
MGFFLCYILPLLVLHLVFALIGGLGIDTSGFSFGGMLFGLIPCLIATFWNKNAIMAGFEMHEAGEHLVPEGFSYIGSYFKFIGDQIKNIIFHSSGVDGWAKPFFIIVMLIITIFLIPIMLIEDLLFYISNAIYFSMKNKK